MASIIKKEQIQGKIDGSNKVTAIIEDVKYNNITPKIILNESIFSDIKGDIKYKQKDAIYPGINVIDIDWNGALVNNIELNSTSDLIKLLNQLLTNQTNIGDVWEDVITISPSYSMYYLDANQQILNKYNVFFTNKKKLSKIKKKDKK